MVTKLSSNSFLLSFATENLQDVLTRTTRCMIIQKLHCGAVDVCEAADSQMEVHPEVEGMS
jgi:hypothetical protein